MLEKGHYQLIAGGASSVNVLPRKSRVIRWGTSSLILFFCSGALSANKSVADSCIPPLTKASSSSSLVAGFLREYEAAANKRSISGLSIAVQPVAEEPIIQHYGEAMDGIARAVKEKFPYRPKSVVYLYSGTDAGVFRAFPDAEIIFMQGQAPFSTSLETKDLDLFKSIKPVSGVTAPFSKLRGWVSTGQFNGREGVGPAILGALAGNLPGIRIHSIYLFEKPSISRDSISRINAIVNFDQGEATPMKHLVYFSEFNLTDSFDPATNSEPWWFSALGMGKPDSIYEKASDTAWGLAGPNFLQRKIISLLFENNRVPYAVESVVGRGQFSFEPIPTSHQIDLLRFRTEYDIDIGYSGIMGITPLKR